MGKDVNKEEVNSPKEKQNVAERYFAWEEKNVLKKLEREQRIEEKWGKYRLIKNKRIRAAVWLGIFVIYIIALLIFL